MSEEIPQKVCVQSEKPGEPQHLWGKWKEKKDEDREERQRVTVTNQGARKFQEKRENVARPYQSGFSREIEPKILRDLFSGISPCNYGS